MPGLFFVAANMVKGNDGNYLLHGIEIEVRKCVAASLQA